MTPRDAILAHVNRKLGKYELYRALLAHDDWRVPRPQGAELPTIMISDAAMTPSIWAFSDEAAYADACKAVDAAAIGPVARLAHLDEALSAEDPRAVRLSIDPSSVIAFHVQTDELAVLRRLARGVRVERAMTERDCPTIRAYDRYGVPYFGELGKGHNLITLPSARGSMLAAFTAADAIDAFLAAGSAENRAQVKFAIVDGEQLFGIVEGVAKGVLINAAGPKTFGFELDACREIAAAG